MDTNSDKSDKKLENNEPFVFNEEVMKQIKMEYWDIKGRSLPLEKINITYLGTYNGYVALHPKPAMGVGFTALTAKKIADYIFGTFSCTACNIYVWKYDPDGFGFIELQKAYDNEWVTSDDVGEMERMFRESVVGL